jgi:IMP cyclohydrolase
MHSARDKIVVSVFNNKNENGVYLPLYHKAYDKERISSIEKIQDMIHALIKE